MAFEAKAVLGALGPLAVAVIALLTAFGIVDWSAAQTALVTAEAGALIGFVTALVAHFWPQTKQEPVALAATFTAAVSATTALGTGFGWWNLTEEQVSTLASVITAIIGVGSAMVARNIVTAPRTGDGQTVPPAGT
jgi:putative flippase GtrA